jgi:2-polyprenyl-3-methyl-5-hydroxy-6-metoxy-1,4-benzoquinol methylase
MNKSTTSNLLKHQSSNPVQQYLITKFYSELLMLIKHTGARKILDVGCGEGFTLSKLKEKGIGKNNIGVDYSEKSLAIGHKLFPKLELKQDSIYNLHFNKNTFDLVLCTEVLEHLEKPNKALSELIRVTKKYLLFSVPNEPWFRLSNLARGKNISRWGNDIEHINHWSRQSFLKLLDNQGISVLKTITPFPWIIVLGIK